MGKVRAFLLGILVTSSVISEVSGGRAGWRDACEGMCGSGFVGQARGGKTILAIVQPRATDI
jgi:hypothetical protein